ncbi:MAG: hypothetical protein PHC44_08835 [Lutispora sp.]|nr:hypothetical protein [Lutispora sp.]MDD4834822.1 hypothetical protein [Lutispora sp.]
MGISYEVINHPAVYTIEEMDNLGVHPNDNTATVVLSYDDLKRIVSENGNKIMYVNILTT